jgi:2-methylisocitrate lyase-like PEP mutase family enzyme
VPAEQAMDETLARGALYRDTGADGLFVPGLIDAAGYRKIVDAIDLPINALVWPQLPDAATLKDAGVRRISAGAGTARAAMGAMRRAALDLLNGHYDAMNAEAEGCPNLNALMQ